MNALQRDLKRLVPMVEAAGAARAAADPHRQKLHVQPPVGWLNDPNGLCQIGSSIPSLSNGSPPVSVTFFTPVDIT